MNFYIVFTKNRKKFDKYVKVNKIRNKVIIDINQYLIENEIFEDYSLYKEYFNVLIYTKITQSISKSKDIYYLPDFTHESFNIEELYNIKEIIKNDMKFNILVYFDEFESNDENINSLLNNLSLFDATQLLKSY